MAKDRKVDPVSTLRTIRDSIMLKPAVSFEGMFADRVVFQDQPDHVEFRIYMPPEIDSIAVVDAIGNGAAQQLARQLITDYRQVTTSELRLYLLHIAARAEVSENKSLLTGYKTALDQYTSPTLFVFALQHVDWIGPPVQMGAIVIGKLSDGAEMALRELAAQEGIAGRFKFDKNQPSDLTDELFNDRYEATVDRSPFDSHAMLTQLEQSGVRFPADTREIILHAKPEEPEPEDDYVPYYPVLLGISVPGQGHAALRRARRDVEAVLGAFWLADTERDGWAQLPPGIFSTTEYEADGSSTSLPPLSVASTWAMSRTPYISFAGGKYLADYVQQLAAAVLLDGGHDGGVSNLVRQVAEAIGTNAGQATPLKRRLAAACRYGHVAATLNDPADRLAMTVVGMECLVVRTKHEPAVAKFKLQLRALLSLDDEGLALIGKMYDGRSGELHAGDAALNIDALFDLARLSEGFLRSAARRYSSLIDSGTVTDSQFLTWVAAASSEG